MTTRIQSDFQFQAGVFYDNAFMMNSYDVSLHMDVETASIREQNIAMERIKYFFSDTIDSCVFVNAIEKKVIEKFTLAGINVCTMPEVPYDQMVAIALMVKLNAITENRLVITDIALVSKLGAGVSFLLCIDESVGPFEEHGWWKESDRRITSLVETKKEKIVNLFKTGPVNWKEVGLGWKDADLPSAAKSEIVFSSIETDKQ